MVGITKMTDGDFCIRLDVDGPFFVQSVAALVETLALLQDWGRVQLNLAGVRSIDATGVAVLQFLMARGVEITSTTALVEAPLTGGASGN